MSLLDISLMLFLDWESRRVFCSSNPNFFRRFKFCVSILSNRHKSQVEVIKLIASTVIGMRKVRRFFPQPQSHKGENILNNFKKRVRSEKEKWKMFIEESNIRIQSFIHKSNLKSKKPKQNVNNFTITFTFTLGVRGEMRNQQSYTLQISILNKSVDTHANNQSLLASEKCHFVVE